VKKVICKGKGVICVRLYTENFIGSNNVEVIDASAVYFSQVFECDRIRREE